MKLTQITSLAVAVALAATLCAQASGKHVESEKVEQVWLLGNDFHTSIVLRARDVPYRSEISGDPHADEIAIGWGANQYYRKGFSSWALIEALAAHRGAIQVIPVRGPIALRFPKSDVILLNLTPKGLATLVNEINRSFAYTRDHQRILLGPGYYPRARFYLSSERFYFPYVCNSWVALKLKRAGLPFSLAGTVTATGLVREASRIGKVLQRHHGKPDDF
jgi:hypothetical protein